MKIDKDIQESVADEFCDRVDKGENWLGLIGSWVIPEMERRQKAREKKPE